MYQAAEIPGVALRAGEVRVRALIAVVLADARGGVGVAEAVVAGVEGGEEGEDGVGAGGFDFLCGTSLASFSHSGR